MNRKERRKAGIKTPVRTYTLNEAQVEQLKQNVVEAAYKEAFKFLLCVPCLALRDKFGFGSKRLKTFIDASVFWLSEAYSGKIGTEEIEKALKEEVGFDIHSKIDEIMENDRWMHERIRNL